MSKSTANKGKIPRSKPSKAHEAARHRFTETGVSIADWARQHGFPAYLVYTVLAGRETQRGKSHEIAVLLGIKRGTIPNGGATT
jgi:gp16 family phage-associated protein